MRLSQQPATRTSPSGHSSAAETPPANSPAAPAAPAAAGAVSPQGTTRGQVGRANADALRGRLGSGSGTAAASASTRPAGTIARSGTNQRPALRRQQASRELDTAPLQGDATHDSLLPSGTGIPANLPPGLERPVLQRQANVLPAHEETPGPMPELQERPALRREDGFYNIHTAQTPASSPDVLRRPQ